MKPSRRYFGIAAQSSACLKNTLRRCHSRYQRKKLISAGKFDAKFWDYKELLDKTISMLSHHPNGLQ